MKKTPTKKKRVVKSTQKKIKKKTTKSPVLSSTKKKVIKKRTVKKALKRKTSKKVVQKKKIVKKPIKKKSTTKNLKTKKAQPKKKVTPKKKITAKKTAKKKSPVTKKRVAIKKSAAKVPKHIDAVSKSSAKSITNTVNGIAIAVNKNTTSNRLHIHLNDTHRQSPFIIHLTHGWDLPKQPEEIIATEENLELELAVSEIEVLTNHNLDLPAYDASADLTISRNEIVAQLKEDYKIYASQASHGQKPLKVERETAIPKIQYLLRDESFERDMIESELRSFIPTPKIKTIKKKPKVKAEPEIVEMYHPFFEEITEWVSGPFGRLFPHGWHRAIAAFVMLSFVFVLPLHAYSSFFTARSVDIRGDIESEGYAAISQIELATDALKENDPAYAIEKFQEASDHFEAAEEKISKVNLLIGGLVKILPNTAKTYQAGKDLITAGANLSEAAELFSRGLVAAADEQSGSLITKIEIAEAYVTEAMPSLEQAEDLISGIEVSSLPPENQASFTEIKSSLPKAKEAFSDFLTYADVIKNILGADYKKRYLLVFQNNTEIRPSGGFIGSFAEVDVYRGEVRKIDVPKGGSYDLQGSLTEYVAPPTPIQLINSRWEFQDANWFPDFPTTAEKLIWFYTQSGGPTVDGVIAFNATHVADLLNYTGSVDMDEYDRTIDSENFIFETQKIVELEYDKIKNNPKQFIGDLAPVLVERILEAEPDAFVQILSHLREGLDEKEIQIYLTDNELENKIIDLGWAGEVKSNDGDFLMIVDANLGGGKTDGVITQDASLTVDIQTDGSIVNTLSVTRTHHGIKNELFSGVNNVDYIRIYTPRGSELISANGQEPPDKLLFEEPIFDFPQDEDLELISGRVTQDPESETYINQEFGKTVFGNWVQTKPGESSTITFTYKLPFKAGALENQPSFYNKLKTAFGFSDTYDYTLQVQKQSGINDRNLDINISYPNNFDLLWTNGREDDKSISSIINNSDSYLSALFERRY